MNNCKVLRSLALFLSACLFFAPGAIRLGAQSSTKSAALPTVQEVMDRYVQALGGRDAIFRHKSMTVREKLEVEGKGISLDRVVSFKDGNSHEKIVFQDGTGYQSGYDGTTAWEMDSKSGPALIKGDEAKSKARDADMYYPARILDYFNSMEVVDISEFEGHACYHLKGTNKWGKVNEHFYDTTSGLLIGYRFNSSWRGGAGEEREVFTDYKNFDGWLIPTRVAHKDPNRTLTEVISSVTFDDVPDSAFHLPDAVKALLGKPESS
jgi:hypothetical protein